MYENILIVDDEFVTVKMIEDILENANYKTATFTSVLEALESLQRNHFDLILSDYYMPEMNGEEFMQRVKEITPQIPFIILTISTDVEKAIKLIKNGATDFITKPFKEEELIFRITKETAAGFSRIISSRFSLWAEI